MGNSSSLEYSLLSEAEKPIVIESFKCMSKDMRKIKKNKLKKFWDMQVDPSLIPLIVNFLFGKERKVRFQKFAGLYVFSVRGTIDERILLMKMSMEPVKRKKNEVIDVNRTFVREYINAVVHSFMRVLRLEQGKEYKSWGANGFRIVEDRVHTLVESLTSEFYAEIITRADAERFYENHPIFLKMLECVFVHLYNYRGSNQPTTFCLEMPLLPTCENIIASNYMPLIDISQIFFLNSLLPNELRSKWRILFSSKVNEESLESLLFSIIKQGPTLIIVEESNGNLFGGFAAEEWKLSSQFIGDSRSFLFSFRPQMQCFKATRYNNNYQYLNINQKTMPNGLGMGGQIGYFGFFIDETLRSGSSTESCTTFRDYHQLSTTKSFGIKSLEVWGLGETVAPKIEFVDPQRKPNYEDEDPSGSVISNNLTEKALLAASGKQFYSEEFIQEE